MFINTSGQDTYPQIRLLLFLWAQNPVGLTITYDLTGCYEMYTCHQIEFGAIFCRQKLTKYV